MDIYEYALREFEKFYDSKMTVSEHQDVKDGAITKGKWVPVLTDLPCRVSQKRVINPASEGEFAGLSYMTTLHCSSKLKIKAGSRITITDCHGVTREYKRSSEGFSSYRTHQEIVLVREVRA